MENGRKFRKMKTFSKSTNVQTILWQINMTLITRMMRKRKKKLNKRGKRVKKKGLKLKIKRLNRRSKILLMRKN